MSNSKRAVSNHDANKEITLALGMVYSNTIFESIEPFGQEWRDQKRLNSLSEKFNFIVYSMDDKHHSIIGKHCDANFNNPRRMMKSIKDQNVFKINLGAKNIILDYFFSPVRNKSIFNLKYFKSLI